MKSTTEATVKGKSHKVNGKTKKELEHLMNDPTLEGKDENKVGRVQRKAFQEDNGTKKRQGRLLPSPAK
jgi:hypothetical protein